MKLSTLLSISQLSLSADEKLNLAYSNPSSSDLAKAGAIAGKTQRMLSFLAQGRTRIVFYGMPSYPKQFYQLENPPFRLMYTQDLPTQTERMLLVCGTRYADGLGSQSSYELALEAGANDTIVVTSNSRGIDRCALYALKDSNKRAVVVCDCGLAVNRITNNALLSAFCLISPYEPDDEALRFRCLSRNVLSTALAEVTLVVQAPLKSGALHCTTCALDLGRDVYVHSLGTRGGSLNAGSRSLAEMGCEIVDGYQQIAALRSWPVQARIQAGSLYRFGPSCYSLDHA
ncbi:DNA-processing protein DprA [Sphaerochaeta globosa]|uniref:SMF family protein n=1 Tax=Sphaerochaeta globosa (strain ATCC BAA-1886 / DSM 22777 / Buddy) TaxID=158189 RepID=F0RYV9_SPHGB|nr:DNA-processing protein DprA [Sphaerochaeta globosa]ADY13095.1 SMF family protein [Sphaerochaeta globosa str. Buddy]